jgi:hypothetical protein
MVQVNAKFFDYPIEVPDDEADSLRRQGLLRDDPPPAPPATPATKEKKEQ